MNKEIIKTCDDYNSNDDYNSDIESQDGSNIEIAFDDFFEYGIHFYEHGIQCNCCSQTITEGVVTFAPSQKDRFGDVMASYLDVNTIHCAIELEHVFECGTILCNECLEKKKQEKED